MTENKKFWKIFKPFFSNKGLNSNKLILREKDVLITDEKALATLMNKYFVNITTDLDLKRDSETLSDTSTNVSSILERFHCHQSILKILEALNTPDNFSFHDVSEDEVRSEISKLDGTKSTPVGDIPAGMLKSTNDIHAPVLTKIINLALRNGYFPDDLKAAEVSPIYKKNDDLEKKNYRPVSILPHMSKVFERIMYSKVSWKISYRKYLQDSEKIIAPNTVSLLCLKNGKIPLKKVDLFVSCSWTYQRPLTQ